MKVLILGAHGNLGHQLVKVFSDCDVLGFGSSELDITNEELVLATINRIKPAVIINSSAYNAVDKCEHSEQDFEHACHINGEALSAIVRAALLCGATLVHYSTDYVFDGGEKGGYVEESAPSPINKYGQSKLIGENNIAESKSIGLKYYIIRTSRLFGPRGVSANSKQNFFDIISKKIVEKQEINAVDDEVASFSYTPDIAMATRELLLANKSYGVYHLVNEGSASWYEAAVELVKLLGPGAHTVKPISGSLLPRPAKRPKNSVLVNTQSNPLRSWQDALREYASQYKLTSL